MEKNRKLVYSFLRLPYHARIEVAKRLDLFRDRDKELSDAVLYRNFFRRAKEKGVLDEFWNEVEIAHRELEQERR